MLKIELYHGETIFAKSYDPNQSEIFADVVLANGKGDKIELENVKLITVADPDEYSSLN